MRTLFLFTLILMCALAESVPYQIAPAKGAEMLLKVDKTGLMSGKQHQILFNRYSGTIEYDAKVPAKSRISLEIDSASAQVMDTWVSESDRAKILDQTLKNMLDVKNHKQITFESASVVDKGQGGFDVKGTLTIRGIQKPSLVHVRVIPEGSDRLSCKGTAAVLLKDYGLKPPSAALGAVGTKNEMQLEFSLIASRKADSH